MRRLFAISLSLLACATTGVLAAGASAASKHKSCGTVTPKPVPNSGGGIGAFKVTIVKGKVSCSAADAVFKDYYFYGVPIKVGSLYGRKLKGYTCAGGGTPVVPKPIVCKTKKAEIEGVSATA